MNRFSLRTHGAWALSLAGVLLAPRAALAQVPPAETTATPPAAAPAPAPSVTSTPPPVGASPAPAAEATEAKAAGDEKPSEPFAFGDFTWLNGSSRMHKAVLDTPYFTPEFLLDVNYTVSQNNPIDHTVVGSTTLSRNNEFALQFLGFGGDFHYGAARARLMTQFGERATVVPRNDGSTFRGQYDLSTALRYISEAYGGIHLDVWHGINIDAGIFMSYVGLFSYDNYENWMYLPSYTSDNTPWFFNGIRVQMFPSDKLKIEPWLINGWQTYGRFNEMPGFGAQILYRPVEWLSVLSNDYVGWDTQDNPGRLRFHSDNSLEIRYYNDPNNHLLPKAAFSLTGDIGGESGDGVTPFGGKSTNNPLDCTSNSPCTQQFLSWMAYNRLWLLDNVLAFNVGGGQMHNPGRYLVLAPTGQADPFPQTLSTSRVQYVPASAPFSTSPGTTFDAWDVASGFQYMPNEQVTYDLEFSRRAASVPYFAGHGGVTSPDGYQTTGVPTGWRPDLVKSDLRLIAALLVRF
jgi:hypothetical protein